MQWMAGLSVSQSDPLDASTCCIMWRYLQPCTHTHTRTQGHGDMDGRRDSSNMCCITYESWCNLWARRCTDSKHETCSLTWVIFRALTHLTCTKASTPIAHKLVFTSGLYALFHTVSTTHSNNTHTSNPRERKAHTVLINSFSEAALTHSARYATSHKRMIF